MELYLDDDCISIVKQYLIDFNDENFGEIKNEMEDNFYCGETGELILFDDTFDDIGNDEFKSQFGDVCMFAFEGLCDQININWGEEAKNSYYEKYKLYENFYKIVMKKYDSFDDNDFENFLMYMESVY